MCLKNSLLCGPLWSQYKVACNLPLEFFLGATCQIELSSATALIQYSKNYLLITAKLPDITDEVGDIEREHNSQ